MDPVTAADLRNTQVRALRILGHNRCFKRDTLISNANADTNIAHGTAETLRRIRAISIFRYPHGAATAKLTQTGLDLCDELGHPRGDNIVFLPPREEGP